MWESVFNQIGTSPSKTFLFLSAMFCFGVLLGPLAVNISLLMFMIGLGLLILLFAFLPKTQDRFIALGLCLCLFGLFRYTQSEIPKNIPTVRDSVGQAIRVSGDVVAEPVVGAKSQQVTIGSVHVADKPVFGKVLVSVDKMQSIAYGDYLVFSCSMQKPFAFNGFDYDRYLQAKGVLALCRFPKNLDRTLSKEFSLVGTILSFKQQLVEKMKHFFPEPDASFLFGLVFGGNVGIDKDIQNDFAKTGTSHILAASGFNVSLFTFVFFGWVIQYLGKKRGACVTTVLLGVYMIMAGATAAVVRAAVFGSALLIGSVVGRRASIINTLFLTASLMLLYNPRWLLDDVGFQLSFVAFVAIIFVAPKLETYLEFIPEQFGIRDALAGSLSAIILTLPIMLWQFGSVSLVAPFANVFVLPLLPFLMFYTIAILPFAWISLPVAQFIALPSLWGSRYILSMISIFASPTLASVSVPFARLFAFGSTILLILGSVAFFKKS